jgi:hypothetical protein
LYEDVIVMGPCQTILFTDYLGQDRMPPGRLLKQTLFGAEYRFGLSLLLEWISKKVIIAFVG